MPSQAAQLELRAEAKVADLLDAAVADARLEASGVVAVDDVLYVIFDNTPRIGCLGVGLDPRGAANRLIDQGRADDAGYEDIAYDPFSRHFFVLIEALPRRGEDVAKVREYDEDFGYVSSGWLDFPLPARNKGLEGLTCLRRDGELNLLGLCEGNRCRRGADGRRPGGGRIQVFARGENDWEHVDTIRLPASLWFEDFSSLAIDGGRLCVVSQESSALWLGRLAPSAWEVVGDGVTFMFPADADGQTVYCNVEGVSWLSHDQVVIVSDRAKPGEQRSRCRGKDQSVHVFAIPDQSGRYCSSIYAVTLTGARGLRGARGCGRWRWVCARAPPAALRRPGALVARPATTGLLGSGAAWARLLRELLFGLKPVGDRVAGRLGQGDLIGALGDRIVGGRARLRRGAARA